MAETFRVTFAPGVIPDKWLRTWSARTPDAPLEATVAEPPDQLAALREGATDMSFVRLPVDRNGLHVIPLYREVPVVVVAKDHPVAAFDEIDVADLAGEHVLHHPDEAPGWRDASPPPPAGSDVELPPLTVAQAIEVAASGTGVVLVPMSLARLHHRKDVVHRPVTGIDEAQVGLAWRVDNDDPRVETFIGIVRGRTERSSRGGGPREEPRPAGKDTARRTPPARRPQSRPTRRRRTR